MKHIFKYYNQIKVLELIAMLLCILLIIAWKVLKAAYFAVVEFITYLNSVDKKEIKNNNKKEKEWWECFSFKTS